MVFILLQDPGSVKRSWWHHHGLLKQAENQQCITITSDNKTSPPPPAVFENYMLLKQQERENVFYYIFWTSFFLFLKKKTDWNMNHFHRIVAVGRDLRGQSYWKRMPTLQLQCCFSLFQKTTASSTPPYVIYWLIWLIPHLSSSSMATPSGYVIWRACMKANTQKRSAANRADCRSAHML